MFTMGYKGSEKVHGKEAALLVALTLLAFIPATLLKAWVASVIWTWFIVGSGGPAVSFEAFVGVIAITGLLFPVNRKVDQGTSAWEAFGELMGAVFIAPLFVLLLSWLLYVVTF